MIYPVGTKFETPEGICWIAEAPDDGTNTRKLGGAYRFWCATYEIRRWLEKDWKIIATS